MKVGFMGKEYDIKDILGSICFAFLISPFIFGLILVVIMCLKCMVYMFLNILKW